MKQYSLSKKKQLLSGFGVDSSLLHSDQEWGQFEWRQFSSDGKTMMHFKIINFQFSLLGTLYILFEFTRFYLGKIECSMS